MNESYETMTKMTKLSTVCQVSRCAAFTLLRPLDCMGYGLFERPSHMVQNYIYW